ASPSENETYCQSEQENDLPNEPCDEETTESQSEIDLTYDRMIRERLLGDSKSTEKDDFHDTDEFSESALTDTPAMRDSFDPSGATFEVDFNGAQTEYRCDDSHSQDENLLAAADEYLEELLSLEGEVGLEADVVRQIRDIHQHLRYTRQANGESTEVGRNSLTKIDFSTGKSEANPDSRGRLAKNTSALSAKQEENPREKQFRSVFQQAYTKEKDK
ncbi:MAG: hypothetical protein Q4G59_01755, partial [Planctomycetia bacterium]|nr:hypothetical protein [Planctomycetia bacterium]